ncbi:MAG: hypothetical protein WDO13_21790 [Verrucomicrobiota bacterium]
MNEWLLDTGPIVAFFDPRDAAHKRISGFMIKFSGQIVTTSAVIAEAMYFLRAVGGGPTRFVQFLEVTRTRAIDFSATTDLQRAVELMTQYADTPMDFADATLISRRRRFVPTGFARLIAGASRSFGPCLAARSTWFWITRLRAVSKARPAPGPRA